MLFTLSKIDSWLLLTDHHFQCPFTLQHHSLSLTSSVLDHSTTSIYRKNNYPTDLTALYIMSYEFYFKKLRNTLNLEKVYR
jgi:hypothetical protein